jgi:ATP-dependent Zn protease
VAVRQLVGAAFERARALLQRHRAVLEAGAERLLQQETLEREDLMSLRAKLAEQTAVPALARSGSVEAG